MSTRYKPKDDYQGVSHVLLSTCVRHIGLDDTGFVASATHEVQKPAEPA